MIGEIPCIDIRSGMSAVSDPVIANALDQALATHGFCYIQGHGITDAQHSQIFEANRVFHELSEEDKNAIAVNPFHRGYIGQSASQTVTSSVVTATHPNRSESFMVMQSVSPDHPRWDSAIFGPNQWPESLGGVFRTQCLRYFEAMRALADELTQRLAVALRLRPDAFKNWFDEPTIFLRLLRYPAASAADHPNEFGSAPHTDHGFLTLVAQDSTGGLEVQGTDGTWIPLPPLRNTLILNVADMLSIISGGRWPSTPHRVVLNQKERYSTAFFYDPNFDATIQAKVSSATSVKDEMPIRYGDYLMERFRTNYFYRSEK
ncbi:MAG TPA: hypothetical protein DHW07_03345 [Gammaproteobacteria bacterium]|nr:hypothetical protein [Gammaproteobacteria bacterium]